MLEALGLTADAERVYLHILDLGSADLAELATRAKVGATPCRRLLQELEQEGLITGTSDRPRRYVPSRPDIAVEAAVTARREALERARLLANQQLLRRYEKGRRTPEGANPVEIVQGAAAVRQRLLQLQSSAQTEVRILDMPPYVSSESANLAELDALARGVSYRVLYDVRSFDVVGKREGMQRCVEAGEQARILTGLPCKINLADDRLAMTVDGIEGEVTSAIVIYPSPVLEALSALFEQLWSRGSPSVSAAEGSAVLGTLGSQVLQMLVAGTKDETIARQLNVHMRTVRRHVAIATQALGANSRVQLGAEAVRRGWV